MHLLNILIQIDPTTSALVKLLDGGWSGALCVLLIAVIVYMEKQRRAREEELKKEIQDWRSETGQLKDRFDKYQTEDRAKMLEVIQHNSDIMKEVVPFLQRNRS